MDKVDGNPFGERYEEMPEHAHWNAFDMRLEGCRMNRLHELVSAAPFDLAAAIEVRGQLESLAQSKGYGEEDSYHTDFHSHTPDELREDPCLAAKVEQYQDDPDSQYTEEMRLSKAALENTAATGEATVFVIGTFNAMAAARQLGKSLYVDKHGPAIPEDEQPAPPRP
jgi:hypothetical protein